MSLLPNILAGIVSPVAKIFEKREERKRAVGEIRAQSAAAEVDGKVAVNLSRRS